MTCIAGFRFLGPTPLLVVTPFYMNRLVRLAAAFYGQLLQLHVSVLGFYGML